jgi:hypothetical protein
VIQISYGAAPASYISCLKLIIRELLPPFHGFRFEAQENEVKQTRLPIGAMVPVDTGKSGKNPRFRQGE